MKRIVLIIVLLSAQAKATTKLDHAINYVLTNYSQDVVANALDQEAINAADAVCAADVDVADDELDSACDLIQAN
jgi:hypothetical protein